MLARYLFPVNLLLLSAAVAVSVHAETFPLPPPGVDVVGEIRLVYVAGNEDLLDIMRRHNLGYDEIIHANHGVSRWAPGDGTPVVLPTRYILPDAPREGIVLNIPEMRLYYYPPARAGEPRVVITHPVSVGRMDWKTPLGKTKVVRKDVDPPWYPPATIKKEHAAQGDFLPDVVPPGPDNPLGRYALRLAIDGYLIHGTSTNKAYGIGMQVTHGCIRMYPEDIEQFFQKVPVGASVYFVNQPVKVGRLHGTLFLEAHSPLKEDELPNEATLEKALAVVKAKVGPDMAGVDPLAIQLAVEQGSGVPVTISR